TLIGCDNDQIIEGEIASTLTDFYIIGYICIVGTP
ncbi:hypothetical protein LCGC14_3046700, partial [marine sediment metagenome]